MKRFNIIRSQEWWSYKLPPLLAIAYATALMSPLPFYRTAFWTVFLLSSLIVGAIYVSVINDITDLDEDIASGKSNRIQQIPEQCRWLIPAACILLGFVFGYFLYPDLLSCALYLSSWIVFSLYSIKPVRLKNRGIWGVFADGCGSHVFTSLLMVSSITFITKVSMDWIWFSSVGVWALIYGLRGILWHQFSDRENDIKVNLNTYASKIDPKKFKSRSITLITAELLALVIMLYKINQITVFIGLILYFLLVLLRYNINKTQIIAVLKTDDQPYQIIMADFYQVFLPISLLIEACSINSSNFIVLIIHIFLFPYVLWFALHDYMYFIKVILLKIKNLLLNKI